MLPSIWKQREALGYILKASTVIDDIFHEQVWNSNRMLRDWLKARADSSSFDNLKWKYYSINKSPWSCLDENKAFLSTADSAVKLLTDATKPISGWKGIEYRAAFPLDKPSGVNFYPPDMNKMEFELWKSGITDKEQKDATGFFTVIKRSDALVPSSRAQSEVSNQTNTSDDLFIVPYSKEYKSSLEKAAGLLCKASECSDSPRTPT
jgi:hypothetical protein